MSDKIPLEEVVLQCTTCGSKANAREINNDVERYYSWKHMSFIKFPNEGVSEKTAESLKSMKFSCELCHEDKNKI
jgi:DNA-directed RNA polymerase subunit M/transcription elongation factor TFIIS